MSAGSPASLTAQGTSRGRIGRPTACVTSFAYPRGGVSAYQPRKCGWDCASTRGFSPHHGPLVSHPGAVSRPDASAASHSARYAQRLPRRRYHDGAESDDQNHPRRPSHLGVPSPSLGRVARLRHPVGFCLVSDCRHDHAAEPRADAKNSTMPAILGGSPGRSAARRSISGAVCRLCPRPAWHSGRSGPVGGVGVAATSTRRVAGTPTRSPLGVPSSERIQRPVDSGIRPNT